MFTGLVAGVARVVAVTATGTEVELSVDLGELADGATAGDSAGASIALSGVCCTVTGGAGSVRSFRLTAETLRRTWLGEALPGHLLNIENPLRAGDPFGGHVVQGHVDGVGHVVTPVDPASGGELRLRMPAGLAKYCVEKGSIALDGVSLTIAAIDGTTLMLAIIPHTASATTLGRMQVGQPVHVEVDILAKYVAKYVERLLAARHPGEEPAGEEPAGEEPAGEEPAGDRPAGD